MGRIGHRFGRVEPRRRVGKLVLGLLAGLPRANCWTIAEHAGDTSPDGMQHLLARAVWDHDAVRDDLRAYVVEHLGVPHAVLVVDETGDVKKGTATVGVQRQYTGTAGRVENAQVAVYLTYASPRGYAFIDRALYLPRSWADDPDRRAAAGVPDDITFATKPALARQMIARALDAGTPVSWVAGDEVYGNDPGLRTELVTRRSATCWPSPRTTGSPPASAYGGRSTWPCGSRREPGNGTPPAAAPRATAGTTGHWSTPSTRPPTPATPGVIGC